MKLYEGMKIRHGVFTSDRAFAEETINTLVYSGVNRDEIKISKQTKGTNHIEVYLEDGTNYVWVKPTDNSRGLKCSQATVDLATCSLDIIRKVILPSCLFADKEDFTLVDSEHKCYSQKQYSLDEMIDRLMKAGCILGNLEINCRSLFGEESPLVELEFFNNEVCFVGGDLK